MSQSTEHAITFECEGSHLIGILHEPAATRSRIGIVIVVGGPQYRVGSHRQFVLMARAFAEGGWPVLRFDYRGMGDSSGLPHAFEQVGADIRAAVDAFIKHCQDLHGVLLWGLCDAASAILMYGSTDPRVCGLVIANPWVRTVGGEARTYLRHYYLRRLLQRSFWRKMLSGGVNPLKAATDLAGTVAQAGTASADASTTSSGFIDRMRSGLSRFKGPTLVLISEHDLTAQEFVDLYTRDRRWNAIVETPLVKTVRLPGADHTFSTRHSLSEATRKCMDWIEVNKFV